MVIDLSWVKFELLVPIIVILVSSFIMINLEGYRRKKKEKINDIKIKLKPIYPNIRAIKEDLDYAITLRSRIDPDITHFQNILSNIDENIICVNKAYSSMMLEGFELDLISVDKELSEKMSCFYINNSFHKIINNQKELEDYIILISNIEDLMKNFILKK